MKQRHQLKIFCLVWLWAGAAYAANAPLANRPASNSAAIATIAATAETAPPAVVNINTATEAEIVAKLTGVGPRKAKAILMYRQKNQGFKSVDDLAKVDGISAATLENLRPQLRIADDELAAPPQKVLR